MNAMAIPWIGDAGGEVRANTSRSCRQSGGAFRWGFLPHRKVTDFVSVTRWAFSAGLPRAPAVCPHRLSGIPTLTPRGIRGPR